MCDGHLQRRIALRRHRRKQRRDCRAQVGADRQCEHLFQRDGTHGDERGQEGCRGGGTLQQHRHHRSDGDQDVSVQPGDLEDDARGVPHQQPLEHRDQQRQRQEDGEGPDDEHAKSGNLIVAFGCIRIEEVRAVAAGFVATDEADLGACLVGGIVVVDAFDGIEFGTTSSARNGVDDLLVGLEDLGAYGRNVAFDGTLPAVAVVRVGAQRQGGRNPAQVPREDLDGQEHGHGHEVEKVVNGGTRKGQFELFRIPEVAERNHGVGDGRADVGAHDHEDGLLDRDDRILGADQPDDDGRRRRRRLQHDRGESADHDPGNRVDVTAAGGKQFAGRASRHDLGPVRKKVQS
mmetsp:Transcript_8775/g.25241  ORF Transcript_8775/g.25241 Transcript_8775/m.25241 type:complete len:347 (-) Transcript_8775:571-1611(-)